MTELGSACAKCGATYRDVITICPNCKTRISADLPLIGEIFDGKYEIVERLGGGGMGEVFKARHVHLRTFRAIKVMRRSLLADEASRKRFSREARLATRVHHRNVAILYDYAIAPGGSYYIVSELVDGVTLRHWSSSPELFSESGALDILVQTLHGLEHLHRAGILHRDLSPDNIMISTDVEGRRLAKIIDLGLAKLLADTPGGDSTTRAGLFLGNPRYSSPEQLGALPEGAEIDARSDLYSAGVVLYEVLTGAPPFASATPQGYAAKHLIESPPPLTPRPGARSIPIGQQRIVEKALQKRREDRYRTAQELADALAPFLSEQPPEPESEPAAEPARAAAKPTSTAEPVEEQRSDASLTAPALLAQEPPPAAAIEIVPATSERVITQEPTIPQRSSRTRVRLAVALVAVAVLAAIAGAIASLRLRGTDDDAGPVAIPTPPAAMRRSPERVADTPLRAVPLVLTGKLVIDAVPWGRVVSVHDGAKEWIPDGSTYTPRTLQLPVGNYTVALLGPDGTRQSVVVGLTSTEPAFVRIDFHAAEGAPPQP
jgi:serine/threonine-protein kinase